MKNIHILRTDKPSRLHLAFVAPQNYDPHNKEFNIDRPKWVLYDKPKGSGKNIFAKNIYITNSEETKEGDYILISEHKLFDGKKEFIVPTKIWKKIPSGYKTLNGEPCFYTKTEDFKKVILTTDQDLIKDGVQAIDDDFLKWFINNSSYKEIEVKTNERRYSYDMDSNIWIPITYKIIIPKEEPKQELGGIPKGIVNMVIGKPKQETLEEAVKKYCIKKYSVYKSNDEHTKNFIAGAKWQQEQICNSEFLQKLRETKSDAEARRLIYQQFNK